MVFVLYFQQATHVRPRPSLIVFDTYGRKTSGLDVLPTPHRRLSVYNPSSLSIHRPDLVSVSLSARAQALTPDILHFVVIMNAHGGRHTNIYIYIFGSRVVIVYPKRRTKRTVRNSRLIQQRSSGRKPPPRAARPGPTTIFQRPVACTRQPYCTDVGHFVS